MDEEKKEPVKLITKSLSIPKEEQLEAFCKGGAEFYKLVKSYMDPADKRDIIPNCITFTQQELIEYVRKHPEVCRENLYKEGDPRYHEWSILEYDGKKYKVYDMDHDDAVSIREFDDFAEATVNFLYRNIGLPPDFFLYKDK